MKKRFLSIALLIIIWQIVPLELIAQTDYFKDTVWTRQTDQKQGFYMVKFSNNDSIIVAHGYEMDLFFNTQTGQEIGRINCNHEVFFINNDNNFIQSNQSRSKLYVYDTKSFNVIDSLESDGINTTGSICISRDEKFLISTIAGGIRVWDLSTKKILKTKLITKEPNLIQYSYDFVKFTCDPNKFIAHLVKTYEDPNHPGDSKYFKVFGNYIKHDFLTMTEIDSFPNSRGMFLSNTCKYFANATGDPIYGVEIYDFNTKQLLKKLTLNGLNLTGIEFSPDDKYIVVSGGTSDRYIKIWDIPADIKKYEYNDGGYCNFDISNDGKRIISSIGYYLLLYPAKYDGVSIPKDLNIINFVYPNPVTGKATIEFIQPDSEVTSVTLTDINGTLFKNLSNDYLVSGLHSIEIDVSSYSSGNYIISVQNQHLSNIYKLIIIK